MTHEKHKHIRISHGALKEIAPHLGISPDNLSAIINGHRDISKARSIMFAKACSELGYSFTASDWMFNPEKIKSAINNKANNNHDISRDVSR